jgi:hypothetical protein
LNSRSTIFRLIDDLRELLSERFDFIKYPNASEPEEHDVHKIADDQRRIEQTRQHDTESLEKIKVLSEELKIRTKPIRDLRNTTKGHRDLNTVLEQYRESKDSGVISIVDDNLKFQDINRSIEIIYELLTIFSWVHLRSFNAGTVYRMKPIGYFLENLEEGNKWREKHIDDMKKAFQNGIEQIR